jgi:hypothetical protein
MQWATVACLRPATDAERELFSRITLPPGIRTFHYFDPEPVAVSVAVNDLTDRPETA